MSTRQAEVWRVVADAAVPQDVGMVSVLLLAVLVNIVGVPFIPRLDVMVASTTDEAESSRMRPRGILSSFPRLTATPGCPFHKLELYEGMSHPLLNLLE